MKKLKTGSHKTQCVGHLFYKDTKLPYTIITDKKLKNFYIYISNKDGIIVKNPNFSLQKVESLITSKARWIYEKSIHIAQRKTPKEIWEQEKKVLLFGEKQDLHVHDFENFYKMQTQQAINIALQKYTAIMHLYPTKIGFRKAKRRWGSCSGLDSLSFNISIAQLPLTCIEYIVVHELAHIKHKNHQKAFWQLVAETMPNFQNCEAMIKNYTPALD
ncbi:MAG: DUF45 domain-containing protein [Sulfurospirillum sp.]|nr:DUF45 domain-containing protein [Sulfurospirillum sp.]